MASVVGTVKDSAGVLLGGARVELRRADGSVAAGATSGSGGTYGLSVAAGTYTPAASKSGYVAQIKALVTVVSKLRVDFALAAVPAVRPLKRLTTDLHVPARDDVDVTDLIPAALATVASGSDVELEGLYRIDRAVNFVGLRDVRILGSGSEGFRRFAQAPKPSSWPSGVPFYQYLRFQDCLDVAIEGFGIWGPLTEPRYDALLGGDNAHAVQVAGASARFRGRHLTFRGPGGDFLTVSEHGGAHPYDVLLEYVDAEVCGRQLIGAVGGQARTIGGVWVPATLVRFSSFRRSGRSGLDVEPSNALGTDGTVVEDTELLDAHLYCVAGGNSRPHRHTILRRVRMTGRLGPMKYGGDTAGTHVGLVVEDCSFEPIPGGGGGLIVWGVQEIAWRRSGTLLAPIRLSGMGSRIEGTGEVRDSVFAHTSSTPPSPIVCLRGVSGANNVGAAPCV